MTGAAATAGCLLAVIALEIIGRLSGAPAAQHAAWAAAGLTVAVTLRRLGPREAYLLSLCVVLTGLAAAIRPDPGAVIAAALDQATFLMAFILLIGLLHEAAATSPSVEACGRWMASQPPGRRYHALYAGSGAMAVLFNIGVVSFLVPLLQRGIAASTPGDPLNPLRERRQIGAVLRGFAWCVIWAPTAIAPLALMELIPGIERDRWIALGLGLFAVMMVLGGVEDALRFRARRPPARRPAPPFPAGAALRFAGACAALLGLAGAVMALHGGGVIFGLMAACPLMLVGWLLAQNGGLSAASLAATGARLRAIARDGLPASAPVAVTLAASGFIGRAAAALTPAERLAQALGVEAAPDWLFLGLMPSCIAVLSLLALSPIMMAVFFGSLIGALPEPPADPTLIALSISCGWALSMTFSPFATVVLLIERVGGVPARRQTWEWNLAFTALAALLLPAVFAALTGGA